jgi:hypothetical protein
MPSILAVLVLKGHIHGLGGLVGSYKAAVGVLYFQAKIRNE